MAYIDLRKVGRAGLKEIRRQVVRLKKLGKTGKEIEELTGVRQNRASEIWAAHQREGDISLERKKYGRKDKIEVFFLPPYAPEYHPYEYLNHAVKISAHSVQQPYTAEDLCQKFRHSCGNYSIIRLSCPDFSSIQRFPVFMCRSNI